MSCNKGLDIENNILKIEQLLKIKIVEKYEVLDEENTYPIKGDITHFVSVKFAEKDYEKIYNSAQSFFIKPDYGPLYPEQNINLIYFESQDENLSIYLDTQLKQLYFTVSY